MAILPWRFANMGVSGQACSKVSGDCCQHMGQLVLAILGTVVALQILINILYKVLPRFQQLIASYFHFWTYPQMAKKLINSSEDVAQGKNPEILDQEKRDGKPPGLTAEEVDDPHCVQAGDPVLRTQPHVCCCPHLQSTARLVSLDLRGEEASPPFCLSVHSCSLTPDSQACSKDAPSPEDSGSGPRQARSGLHSRKVWAYAKDQRSRQAVERVGPCRTQIPGQAVEGSRYHHALLPGQSKKHTRPLQAQLPGKAVERPRPRQAQGSRKASIASSHQCHHPHRHHFFCRACPVTSPALATSSSNSSSSSCNVAYCPQEETVGNSTGRVVSDANIAHSWLGRGDAEFKAPSPYIYTNMD
ncbi:uncharacterized protein [Narcine bancroftii]|uniref:uncharacterized protein n=1 Tax=Narcine bancroftii TaxID=1343680 RepID=UPI003831D54C